MTTSIVRMVPFFLSGPHVLITMSFFPPCPHRTSWSHYNHRNKVDISMGVCGGILQTLEPILMAISGDPWDPNVDPDSDDFKTGEKGQMMDSEFIPSFIRSVRIAPIPCLSGFPLFGSGPLCLMDQAVINILVTVLHNDDSLTIPCRPSPDTPLTRAGFTYSAMAASPNAS